MTTSTKPASSTFDKTLIYIFASGILLLILDAVIQFDPAVLVFAVLSLAGSFVCVLIIMYNMQKDNPLTRKLCQNIGAFDCNKVLHSPAAQIFKGVNLGDIGLIYFLAQFLFLSFGKYGAFNTLLLLSIPSFLAWCATFWSIWYQWKVVKSWCKMCLLTTAVIWLQAGTFFYSLKNICIDCTLFNSTSLPGAGLLITCSLLACTWLLIKPIIGKAEELTTARQQIRQWKRHTSVFNALLKKQAAIDAAVWENDFLLGNPEGAVIWMMVVVNPFCPACALEYKLLSSLIQTYPGSICLIVRFGINYNNRVAEQTLAVQELLSAFFYPTGQVDPRQILDDWFKPMDREAWREKYRPPKVQYPELLQKYKDWCLSQKIARTPELYINGHQFPPLYHPEDLRTLVPRLIARRKPFSADPQGV